MVNERARASELANILREKKQVGEKKYTNLIGPMSGDGHSFDDAYEEEEVIEPIYDYAYSFRKRIGARRELKRIVKNTEDESLRNDYSGKAKLEIDWGNAIVGGLFYSGSLGLAGFLIYKWLQ